MANYQSVKSELDRGTPPGLLCATCPWDRLCITPPTMTADQVKQKMDETLDEPAGNAPSHPDRSAARLASSLVGALMFAGKDTQAEVCPVFAMRLSGPDGRTIADGIRSRMREWNPAEV